MINFFTPYNKINKKLEETTVSDFYEKWLNELYTVIIQVFKWNTGDYVLNNEIEKILAINGVCAVTDAYDGKITAFYGNMATPTKYYDIFSKINVCSPLFSDGLEIGKQTAIIKNTSTYLPSINIIERVASMLAHIDITIINVLVNMRVTSTPIAVTDVQLNSLKSYLNKLRNGIPTPIADKQIMGIEFKDNGLRNNQNITELVEARENILDSFYNNFGIATAFKKKGNMIAEEVTRDNPVLDINIDDMLQARLEGCEMVNKLYGTKWIVKINPKIIVNKGENENV